jgi:GT2 family glycosyltransferase
MRTGYVIPSLGRDLESLEKAIDSVLVQSKSVEIILVAPASAVEVKELAERKNVQVVNDTQKGVANAFNLGIEYLANRGVEIFGVLGEDDFLLPYSMINLLIPFKDHKVQAAVGHIWYINDLGKIVFHNRAFPMLLPILHWIK